MKDILRNASAHTQTVFDAAFSPFRGGNGALGLAFMPLVLGVTASAFVGFLATETGAAILGEVRRRSRLHAPHPESPSLRGTPTAAELKADCAISPRTLLVRLRLGSRLADLEPTLDSGNHYIESPTGAKRIQSRGRGMRGYIADNRLGVSYSTLMRYRRLALRLRQLLQLDPRLPLEWLLPGESPDQPLPSCLQTPYATARRRLSRLLRASWNFDRLRKQVDAQLGIPELLTVRRAKGGNYTVTATPTRLESTMRTFARLLTERKLPPGLSGENLLSPCEERGRAGSPCPPEQGPPKGRTGEARMPVCPLLRPDCVRTSNDSRLHVPASGGERTRRPTRLRTDVFA